MGSCSDKGNKKIEFTFGKNVKNLCERSEEERKRRREEIRGVDRRGKLVEEDDREQIDMVDEGDDQVEDL